MVLLLSSVGTQPLRARSGPDDLAATLSDLSFRLRNDPAAIADFDYPAAIREADLNTLCFLTQIICSVPMERIDTPLIGRYYVPCLGAAIKRFCAESKAIADLRLGRELLIDGYLEQAARATDAGELRQWLYDFFSLGYTIRAVVTGLDSGISESLKIPNYHYNNLHYIETCLYGSDRYMQEVLGDRLPEGLFERIVEAFGEPQFPSPTYWVMYAVWSAFRNGEYELIADNAYELLTFSSILLSDMQSLSACIGDALRATGREDEIPDLSYRVGKERYGEAFDALYTGAVTNLHRVQLSELLEQFTALRERLRGQNCGCAEYLPCFCPAEERADPRFAEYYTAYARLQLAVIRSMQWMDHTQPSAVATLQQVAAYFECADIPVFLSQAIGVALDLYTMTGATWTLDTLERALPLIAWYGSFNPYALTDVARYYYGIGAVEKMEEVLCGYLLPYLGQCTYPPETLFDDLNSAVVTASLLTSLHKQEYAATAEHLIVEAEQRVDRLASEQDKRLIYGLIADYCYEKGDYAACISYLERVSAHCRDREYRLWNELGLFQAEYARKNYPSAAGHADRMLRAGTEHPLLRSAEVLAAATACYARTSDWRRMEQCAQAYLKQIGREVRTKVYNLSGEDREALWAKLQHTFPPIVEAYALGMGQRRSEPVLARLFYDWMLLAKGLLLEADNRTDSLLRNHPDSLVRQRYAQMKALSGAVDAARLRSPDPRELSVQEYMLSAARQDMMAALRNLNGALPDEQPAVDWLSVRNRLRPHEAAVEFASLPVDGQRSYVALLLRSDYRAPRVVPLCTETELTQACGKLREARLYANPVASGKLYALLWKPLEEYLAEGDTLYFAVDGALHLYNLEVLRDASGHMADERYNLRRLSSTRELCRERQRPAIAHATLFGALNYRMDAPPDTQDEAQPAPPPACARRAARFNRVPRTPLPETLTEVRRIAELLRQHGIQTDTLLGDKGVEEAFRALSGKQVHILHLATHGFYMEGITDYQLTDEELSPMMRSGLVLSGSETADPNRQQDGLLLASEIADLDLHAVRLVVLSACQTARGKVSEDGVFGLQRGFKQAGAGTILMSLWEVDSRMTELMMTEFYRHLTSGIPRHEAFRRARAAARAEYPARDWAAFIMLD